jgi:8-oxo-dGTP diphosphatase
MLNKDKIEFRSAVYLIAEKNGLIPLLKRAHTGFMDNHWSLIAGRVETDESFITAVIREAKEEAGLSLSKNDLSLVHVSSRCQIYADSSPINWADIYFYTTMKGQKPVNAEKDKHSELRWFPLNDLPPDLAPYQSTALIAYREGKKYSEYGFK